MSLTEPLKITHKTFRLLHQIIQDTLHQIRQAQLLMIASSLAYTTILSIIPLLAVSFAVFQAFGGMQKVYEVIEPLILSNLAEGTGHEVIDFMRSFIANIHTGVLGLTGFIGLIITTMSLLLSIEKSINKVWETKISRHFFHRVAIYWFIITIGPLALSIAVGLATSQDIPIWKIFPQGSGLYIIAVGIFYSIYKWTPQTRVDWRSALISSVITAIVWNVARSCYSIYTSQVLTYHKIYGSLGAIPIVLLWIYILWIIVLSGVALTVALQKNLFSEHRS